MQLNYGGFISSHLVLQLYHVWLIYDCLRQLKRVVRYTLPVSSTSNADVAVYEVLAASGAVNV